MATYCAARCRAVSLYLLTALAWQWSTRASTIFRCPHLMRSTKVMNVSTLYESHKVWFGGKVGVGSYFLGRWRQTQSWPHAHWKPKYAHTYTVLRSLTIIVHCLLYVNRSKYRQMTVCDTKFSILLNHFNNLSLKVKFTNNEGINNVDFCSFVSHLKSVARSCSVNVQW